MSPRRDRAVSGREALLGALVIVLSVAGIIAGSYALLVPADVQPGFPAPVEPAAPDEEAAPGVPVCDDQAPATERSEPLSVTSEDLVECPDLFDGQRVSYAGEAVGAVMKKGALTWLHVNDDAYGLTFGPLPQHRLTVGGNAGMAVVAAASAVDGITTGSFTRHGTGLSITGTYHKNHPADPGSPAIHAESIDVVRGSRTVEHPVSRARLITAGLLAAVTVTLALWWRRVR